MWSKNKKAMTAAEREHVARIKMMSCIVCDSPGPCDAHEVRQGHWWTALPLDTSCHTGPHGIHGDKAMWKIKHWDEWDAINELNRRLLT